MLPRSVPDKINITSLTIKEKEDFYESIGRSYNFFEKSQTRFLNFGKKEMYITDTDNYECHSLLYNHTDPVIKQQLKFDLSIFRQFQSSIFFSETFKLFTNKDWTFLTNNFDESLLTEKTQRIKIFGDLIQHLRSMIEAFRILELHRAVFNANRGVPSFIMRKGEMRLKLVSLNQLYELGAPSYKDYNYLLNSNVDQSHVRTLKGYRFYLETADNRAHKAVVVSTMAYFLLSIFIFSSRVRETDEFDNIKKTLFELHDVLRGPKSKSFTWTDMIELVVKFDKINKLANLNNK